MPSPKKAPSWRPPKKRTSFQDQKKRRPKSHASLISPSQGAVGSPRESQIFQKPRWRVNSFDSAPVDSSAQAPGWLRGAPSTPTQRCPNPRGGRKPARPEKDSQRKPVPVVAHQRLEATPVASDAGEGLEFGDLGLGERITEAIRAQGAITPFALQAVTIPVALTGRHVLGRGRTGSGKTIAFSAPLVERLLRLSRKV